MDYDNCIENYHDLIISGGICMKIINLKEIWEQMDQMDSESQEVNNEVHDTYRTGSGWDDDWDDDCCCCIGGYSK